MKTKLLSSFFILSLLCSAIAWGEIKGHGLKSTRALQEQMSRFGITIAGLKQLQIQEKKIDWDVIQNSLTELNAALADLKKADKNQDYATYFNQLEDQLKDLALKAEKKDKKIYDGFDKLTNTCFSCHAEHRPNDFMIPKNKTQELTDRKSLLQ